MDIERERERRKYTYHKNNMVACSINMVGCFVLTMVAQHEHDRSSTDIRLKSLIKLVR